MTKQEYEEAKKLEKVREKKRNEIFCKLNDLLFDAKLTDKFHHFDSTNIYLRPCDFNDAVRIIKAIKNIIPSAMFRFSRYPNMDDTVNLLWHEDAHNLPLAVSVDISITEDHFLMSSGAYNSL